MDLKYSVVLNTLNTGDTGRSVWEHPHEVFETIANAGYDGVDMDAEPDRIEREWYNEASDLAISLGLKIPALLGAWLNCHLRRCPVYWLDTTFYNAFRQRSNEHPLPVARKRGQ